MMSGNALYIVTERVSSRKVLEKSARGRTTTTIAQTQGIARLLTRDYRRPIEMGM